MATVSELPSDLPKEVFLAKRVQEMALKYDEPPALYRGRPAVDDCGDLSKEILPLPLIDLSLLSPLAKGSKPYEEELEKLKSALTTWGCFQAIGHGLPRSLLDRMRQVSRDFFEQPMEEKQKCAKPLNEVQGYGADPVPVDGVSLDWSDRLVIEVFPKEDRQYKYWPESPASFREVLHEFCTELMKLTKVTNKLFARALNLEETCFQKQLGENEMLGVSLNYYPPCKRPDLVYGMKPHTDISAYTINTEDQEGIQVLKDGKWFTVPNNPDALLIIMADQMEIMTNGVLKAAMHRVLSNLEKDRVSVNVFYSPEKGKEIGPEEALVNEHNKNKFKRVKDYYSQVYWENYNKGKTSISEAQL